MSTLLKLLFLQIIAILFVVEAKAKTIGTICLFKENCYYKGASTKFGPSNLQKFNSTNPYSYGFGSSSDDFTINLMECGPKGFIVLVDNGKNFEVIQTENWSFNAAKKGIVCERVKFDPSVLDTEN